MESSTISLLGQLEYAEWFGACGQPVSDACVVVLPGWRMAINNSSSSEWRGFKMDRQNDLTMELHTNWHDQYQAWNNIVEQVKARTIPLVTAKLASAPRSVPKVKSLRHSIDWDLMAACMETEYSAMAEPFFYRRLADVYISGHFPCGWEGEYPRGRLIVY